MLLTHEVRFTEGNDFQAPVSSILRCLPFSATVFVHNIAVAGTAECVRIDLAWQDGAPARRFAHEIMTLADGRWGRVRLNYRSAYEDTWRDDYWVLNIGLFGVLQPDVCRDTQPMKDYSDLVDLW